MDERRRWLVDGMNVVGSRPDGWWRDRAGAVRSLVGRLEDHAAASGDEVTAVFDGKAPTGLAAARVEVVFVPGRGPGGADDEIARRVASDPRPDGLRVVTSDKELAERVGSAGAEVVPAGWFRRHLEDGSLQLLRSGAMATMQLRSPAFNDHAPIPSRYSLAEGDNLSPPLEWSGVPEGTAELAVLCEDPDAPGGTFVHWVLAGLDPSTTGLAEGETPAGAVEGPNDYGGTGYGGPRPPVGDEAHRYFFRVYAASEPLGLRPGASADDLRRALEGKELAQGTLVGLYQR